MSGFIGNSYKSISNFVSYYTNRYWQPSQKQAANKEKIEQLGDALDQAFTDLKLTHELYNQLTKDYQANLKALVNARRGASSSKKNISEENISEEIKSAENIKSSEEKIKAEYQRTKELWEEAGKDMRELTERVNQLSKTIKNL